MELSKDELSLLYQYIDTNNPKHELNCLMVNDGWIYASDTRAAIRHTSVSSQNLSVHKDVITAALKVPNAVLFDLQDKAIICKDKKDKEIVIVSKNYPFERPVDFTKLFKREFKKEIRFNEISQINGIFALNGIQIDDKFIPKKAPRDLQGVIYIGERDEPVQISFNFIKGGVDILIMPIIQDYLIPQNEL